MNTPAHVAVNFVILCKKGKPQWSLPIVLGSLAPDIPIFFFYFYQKLYLGISERLIWTEIYFRISWQNLFDTFHSFPIMLLCVFITYMLGKTRWALFFISMFLHSLCDLPLHNDDAHRHFFPFTDYRYFSPVSYWDPHHFGSLTSKMESILVICFSIIIWRSDDTRWHKAVPALIIFFYFTGYVAAFLLWS